MDRVRCKLLMELIPDNGILGKSMELAFTLMKMVIHMQVNGRVIKCMVKEVLLICKHKKLELESLNMDNLYNGLVK